MGNKLGSFKTYEEAEIDLLEKGFKYTPQGQYYFKASETGGSLSEAPISTVCRVEITSFQVSAKYSETGEDYEVFQHHFI